VTEPRIRPAGPDDALVVAALTLQCALHRGGATEPGFLDRFAVAGLREQADIVRPLPWPGDSGRTGTLHVRQFFVRPDLRGLKIGEALLRAASQAVIDEGLEALQMRPGRKTRELCERVGLRAAGDVMEFRPGQAG